MSKENKLNLNTLGDFITSRIDESVGGICNIEDDVEELPAELTRNELQKTIHQAIVDFDKLPKKEKIVERADALADLLIESFGYTDSQLICTLTSNKIISRLCKAKFGTSNPKQEKPAIENGR